MDGSHNYNDEYAGLVQAGSSGGLTLKYEVSGGKTDQPMNSISFIVPRLNTQVTSYQGEDGKDIIDNNGEKIEPVVQQGLDGQKYTTTGTKVIDGYYAKAPSNAQGTMSPYGKIGSTYEINMHNGYSAVFKQTDNDGTMSVWMYQDRIPVNGPIPIRPGDNGIYSGVDGIYLRSIYVPQTIDIRYVYKKLGNTVFVGEDKKPFMGKTPTQYPNDPNDPTKAGKVVIPQYEGYTPKINGVPVGSDGFIPTDPGEDTKVVYTANPAKALVRFIDNTDNSTLTDLGLSGKTGETIDFGTAKAKLKSYLDSGYKLVANGNEIPTTETKFDTSDDTNGSSQVFVVRLDHTKTTSDTKVEGKQTVTYVYNDKNGKTVKTKTVEQGTTFTGKTTTDEVTGKTTTIWDQPDHKYNEVPTPVVKGYTADKKSVGGKTVTPDNPNRSYTVVYTPNGSIVPIDPNGNPGEQGDTLTPEPTPEPEPTPNPTPDDQPDSEISSDEHFENVKPKDKLDKTNPKKVDAYKKQRKIIKTKIAKQGHTEIAEPIEDKVTRENNVKVVSDPVENKAAEPKLPQTGEAGNSIIGLLGMLLVSFAAMFGFDSLHSHDKKHKN